MTELSHCLIYKATRAGVMMYRCVDCGYYGPSDNELCPNFQFIEMKAGTDGN